MNHPEAGQGVFIQPEKEVIPGSLVGLVPGVLYSNNEAQKKSMRPFRHKTELPYLLRGNFLLNFEDPLFYPDYYFGRSLENSLKDNNSVKKLEVPGHWINPYAVGHFINHPPSGIAANVTFVDIDVPASFFPNALMRYFPYSFYAEMPSGWRRKERTYRALGVIALEPLQVKTELFVDYSSNRFADQFEPEWLVDPPEGMLAEYLVKQNPIYEFSAFSKWLLRSGDTELSHFK